MTLGECYHFFFFWKGPHASFWKPFIFRFMSDIQLQGFENPAPRSTCGRRMLSSLRPKAGLVEGEAAAAAAAMPTPLRGEFQGLNNHAQKVCAFYAAASIFSTNFQLASCVRWKSWCSIAPLEFLAGVCWIPTTKYFVIRTPWAIAVILHLWGSEGSVRMTALISLTSHTCRPKHSCLKGLCLMHEL